MRKIYARYELFAGRRVWLILKPIALIETAPERALIATNDFEEAF